MESLDWNNPRCVRTHRIGYSLLEYANIRIVTVLTYKENEEPNLSGNDQTYDRINQPRLGAIKVYFTYTYIS